MKSLALTCLLAALSFTFAQQTHLVSSQGPHTSVQSAVDVAADGDIVRVQAGTYLERVVIEQSIALIGEPGAVLDAGGEGTAVTIRAPGTRVEGLEIRNSGRILEREDGGIRVDRAAGTEIVRNHLEDVLFGVDIRQSDGTQVIDNVIIGKDLSQSMRGDGIKLWYSHDVLMQGNEVRRTRDVIIWYSRGTHFIDNLVIDGRYGLHYMYAQDGIFAQNRFVNSAVGSYVMYTQNISIKQNIFTGSHDIVGYGLAFKDADDIWVTDNLMVGNYSGLHFDNTPSWPGSEVVIEGNVIAGNGVAMSWLPNVGPALWTNNSFFRNSTIAQMHGAGAKVPFRWAENGRGNYWDDYVGFDGGQGIGAVPHRIVRHVDVLLSDKPGAQFLTHSPVFAALSVAERAVPAWTPRVLLEDPAPLLKPVIPEHFKGSREIDTTTGLLAAGLAVLAISVTGSVCYRGGVRTQ